MRRAQAQKELFKDFFYICIGVVVAIYLTQSGLIDALIRSLGGHEFASFVAGIFFTSVFTLAPAAIALVHISESTNVLDVALLGALGAMCGDLILFLFIRDKFAKDLRSAFKPSLVRHIFKSFHLGFMKWFAPILGALIIASPLPDEFGLMLMGMSRTKLYFLLPIAFIMNVLGIYLIVNFAQTF